MNNRLICDAVARASGDHPHVQIVLIHLAAHADKKGVCSITQAELAKVCGLSVDTVKRAMKALDEVGFIRRNTRHRRDGRRIADRVEITLDKVANGTLVKKSQGGCEHPGQGVAQPLGQGGCEHQPIDINSNTPHDHTPQPSQNERLKASRFRVFPGGRVA